MSKYDLLDQGQKTSTVLGDDDNTSYFHIYLMTT